MTWQADYEGAGNMQKVKVRNSCHSLKRNELCDAEKYGPPLSANKNIFTHHRLERELCHKRFSEHLGWTKPK